MSQPMPSRRVTVVAPAATVTALGPLVDVWRSAGAAQLVATDEVPGHAELTRIAHGSDALLLAGPRSRAPRTVLPGPLLHPDGDAPVPAAWLPDTGLDDVRRFALAAAGVHRRAAGRRTVAVLGQRHGRYDDLAARVVRLLGDEHHRAAHVGAARWTAYDVHRDDLVARLAGGPALAVYVGHGRPMGWVGYAGVRAHHLGPDAYARWRPAGALLSLTCKTASRKGVGLSFTEAVALRGVAAAALGAAGPTVHTGNARWAVRLGRALGSAATVGDLVRALAEGDPAATSYRLVGDPTAPLTDDEALTSLTTEPDPAESDLQEVAS